MGAKQSQCVRAVQLIKPPPVDPITRLDATDFDLIVARIATTALATSNMPNPKIQISTGREMCEENQFVKVIPASRHRRGVNYQLDVLIHDHQPWNPVGECKAGGIYFTTKKYAGTFCDFGTIVVDVEVPKGIPIYMESGVKFKAPCVILRNEKPLSSLPIWTEEYVVEFLASYPHLFRHIPYQTELIAMVAVRADLVNLDFVWPEYRTDQVMDIARFDPKNPVTTAKHVGNINGRGGTVKKWT